MSKQLAHGRFAELRCQAIALRREGKSRRQIKEILRIGSNQTLNEALRGERPLMSTWRPNAKDDLRAKARELRGQGLAYKEIAAELGVSKSSVSLWVRDLPRPERLSYEECAKRQAAAVDAYWSHERKRRLAAREAVRAGAEHTIGPLTEREILIAGAIAYWCEGTKSKPYRRSGRVIFINSDPRLVTFYLRFLKLAGVRQDQISYRLSIHENADLAAAKNFWLEVTQADPSQFHRPNLKRHNPKTTRLNTGLDYHGCLRIEVLRCGQLYTRIEGWCAAVLAGPLSAKVSDTHGERTLRIGPS
jgi:transcriptional regulator with XRE-family HTH domain